MITREQYLNALEVIDNYHRQFEVKQARIPIAEWLEKVDCTARFYSTVRSNFTFLDEVNVISLAKCRNIGKKTIEEFNNLIKSHETNTYNRYTQ